MRGHVMEIFASRHLFCILKSQAFISLSWDGNDGLHSKFITVYKLVLRHTGFPQLQHTESSCEKKRRKAKRIIEP